VLGVGHPPHGKGESGDHLLLTTDTRLQGFRVFHARKDSRFSSSCTENLTPTPDFLRVYYSHPALEYLREAEGLARTLDDPRRLGWVSAYVSGHHVHTGDRVTEMRTFAQSVEAIAQCLGDVPLQIAAQCYLAAASHLSGDYRDMEHVCRKLMQSLHGQATHERFGLMVFPAVMARGHLARALAERGISDEGDAHGQEAIRIAEALDHPFSVL
jgi:hypothetical protein